MEKPIASIMSFLKYAIGAKRQSLSIRQVITSTRYYNPSKDILLNPMDPRGSPWHPWVECEECFDYDNLAESIIAQTHNDHENYWRTAARSLLSAVFTKIT